MPVRQRRRGIDRVQNKRSNRRNYTFWGTLITTGASIIINDLSKPDSKIRLFFNKVLLPHVKTVEIADEKKHKEEIPNVKYRELQ